MSNDKPTCTCPSGDGSLRWPCPAHPAEAKPAPAVEPKIQRYSVNRQGFMTMDKGPKGGWVRYEDHRSALALAAAPAAPAPEPLTEQQKREMAEGYFSEQWAIRHAIDMLHDCERAHGIGAASKGGKA